jgi:acetylornithine deacetylase/succinyl-diaminopimelate desuccinylase-like protein
MSPTLHEKVHGALAGREEELIEIHRAIVRIPTVNKGDGSPVGEDRVAAAAAEYLRKCGAAVNIEQVESASGRGNLLAEIGNANGKSILWMSHSDVVPPGDEAAWKYPPFSAELAEGRIWGRGSNDCKMLVAAQLFAMACLARLGLPERGRVRLAVGADEEVGGALGFGWLARNRAEFLKCDLAICEGGGSSLGRWGGDAPYVSVGSGEKGRYDVTFRVTGAGGHASTPWGKPNPLLAVAELARRVDAWRPEARPVSPVFARVAEWLALSAGVTESNLEDVIARVENSDPQLGASLGRSLRAQSRLALTPTIVHAGDKANAIPTVATLVCDARLLPGQTRADLESVIAGIVKGLARVEVKIDENTEPSVSPFDENLEHLFQTASEWAVGGPVKIAPTWCAGATDARYVRSAGTPVYGYQLVHPDADERRLGIHCIDESIEARMLLTCAQSLAHFAVEYLK